MKKLGLLLAAIAMLTFGATTLSAEGNDTKAKVEANATDTNATDANATDANASK